jgi:hypothetical protein
MTVGELVGAMQMAREVEDARLTVAGNAKADGEPVADPAAAEKEEEKITSLSSARHTK